MVNAFKKRFGGQLNDLTNSAVEAWQQSVAHRWLQALSPRDRSIVNALAIVLAAVLVYVAVWQPIANWRAQADADYRQALAIKEWIIANEARLAAAGPTTGGRQSGTLLTTIANSAAASGIQLAHVQREGEEGVSVVVQDQEFNRVLQWLDLLTTREQLTIRQLSIDGQPNPGRVTARISIS
jgi:general secretion pathway protein M